MPVMDGLEATRLIRQQVGWYGPIIGLTANAGAEEIARCRQAGMDDVMVKPFDATRLLATVGDWLSAAGGGTDEAEDQVTNGTLFELEKTFGGDYVADLLSRHWHLILRQGTRFQQAGDQESLAFEAHALASQAGFLGFMRVLELCRQVEGTCRRGEPVALELREQVGRELDKALAGLRGRFPTLDDAAA